MDPVNQRFYDDLWSGSSLELPQRFNTWPLVADLCRAGGERLEIGPGLRPRLPLERTWFADTSLPALGPLKQRGARAVCASITSLPFADRSFELIGAFDIVEHVADDRPVFAELARLLADGGVLLVSAPLYAELWSGFDDVVGHFRRYEPAALVRKIAEHGLRVEQSAVYGMQPRNRWLLELGARALERHRERALWWYNRVLLPIGLKLQKPLKLEPGMIDAERIDEALLVCRREAEGDGSPTARTDR
jgi:SAM-dependent methyltransferase